MMYCFLMTDYTFSCKQQCCVLNRALKTKKIVQIEWNFKCTITQDIDCAIVKPFHYQTAIKRNDPRPVYNSKQPNKQILYGFKLSQRIDRT